MILLYSSFSFFFMLIPFLSLLVTFSFMMISWLFAGHCTVQIAFSAPVVDYKIRLAIAIAVGLNGHHRAKELI